MISKTTYDCLKRVKTSKNEILIMSTSNSSTIDQVVEEKKFEGLVDAGYLICPLNKSGSKSGTFYLTCLGEDAIVEYEFNKSIRGKLLKTGSVTWGIFGGIFGGLLIELIKLIFLG